MINSNKKYNTIFFDFDGTISDSKEGITKSTQYALASFGIKVDDLSTLEVFIGPPLEDSFKDIYDFNDDKVELAVEKFREYYNEYGINDQYMYDGFGGLVASLRSDGRNLAIATCKPTPLAKIALKRYGIIQYFDPIVGSRFDGSVTSKLDVLGIAIDKFKEVDKSKMVMIGDHQGDLMAANQHGIDSIGVGYGYGSLDSLVKCNPAHIVQSVDELKKILL